MFARKEPAPDRNDRYGSAPLPHFTERDIGGDTDQGTVERERERYTEIYICIYIEREKQEPSR